MNPAIANRLLSAYHHHRLPHALLFVSGSLPEKIQPALRLVQSVLCHSPNAEAPCEDCSACKRLQSGNHPDLLVLETEKKEIKIDQIRALQRWIFIAPHEATQKIALISQADLTHPPHPPSTICILQNNAMLAKTCVELEDAPERGWEPS